MKGIGAAMVSTDNALQASNRALFDSQTAAPYIIATMKTINAAMFIIRMAEQCIIVARERIITASTCIIAAMFISRGCNQCSNVAGEVIMAALMQIIVAMIGIIAALFDNRVAAQYNIGAMKHNIALM